MLENEPSQPLHTMSHMDTRAEQLGGQLTGRLDDTEGDVLHSLFAQVVQYIRELMAGERPLPEADVSPFLQFQAALLRVRIPYMLSLLYEQGPIVEALISLGVGNAMWQDTRVEPYLQARQDDPDPLLRAAARLALNYMSLGSYVEAKTPPEMSLLQHLEQYTAQVMSGLAR